MGAPAGLHALRSKRARGQEGKEGKRARGRSHGIWGQSFARAVDECDRLPKRLSLPLFSAGRNWDFNTFIANVSGSPTDPAVGNENAFRNQVPEAWGLRDQRGLAAKASLRQQTERKVA